MSANAAATAALSSEEVAARAPWHGYLLADSRLPTADTAVKSDDLARPKYTKIKSEEYLDTPDTLDAKADLFIEMVKAAKQQCIYAGAGISTSSGIWDYASNAAGSLAQPKKKPLTGELIESLKPTPAHRTFVALERAGLIQHWLQQNHDGLAQRAGFPYEKLNEIHGSWHDETNPVIAMSGELRGDLFKWCLEWEKKADLVIGVGTSFSGLNADRVADAAAARHMKKGQGQGLIVISLQKTPKDDVAALRVFAKIDDFMLLVAKKMGLELDPYIYPYKASLTGGKSKRQSANKPKYLPAGAKAQAQAVAYSSSASAAKAAPAASAAPAPVKKSATPSKR